MRTRSESDGPNASDARQGQPEEGGQADTSSLSSPRRRGGHNAKSPRAASSGHHRATPGEKARERKLRDDPMVLVHNPQLVQCRRCGNKIKLSLKSFYDPFHWQKHRERCLKKPEVVVQEMKEANSDTLAHKSSWPHEVKVVTAPKRRPSGSTTPPLIPDVDDEDQSTVASATREESPIPIIKSEADSDVFIGPAPHVSEGQNHVSQTPQPRRETVEEYLLRSQNWNWSQLRTPTFTVPYYSHPSSSEDSDDQGCSSTTHDNTAAIASTNTSKIDASDDWCWSPPRSGFGFQESRVRLT